MSEDGEETSNSRNNKLLIEAITAQMEKMMNEKLDALRQELSPNQPNRENHSSERERQTNPRDPRRQPRDEAAHDYYSTHTHSSQRSQQRTRHVREGRDRLQENLNGLKIKIPAFHGKNDPDAYLDWEKKIELVFNCQHYADINRVKVAATEFYDYALSWWDQVVTSRRRNGEYPIETWAEMKLLMRRRFVPSHYHRELHSKLRKLTQGNRSVEDYFQELETLMLRAHISEDKEATMSRFLGGLNREIQDRVEMQHYDELEEMLHKAILVEQQVKRRGTSRPIYGADSSRSNYQREGKQVMTPKLEFKPFTASQRES